MLPLIELSTAVRTRRSDMGLTQMTLATLSGLSRATVNQLEKGTIKDLSITRVVKLMDAIGLSMSIAAPRGTGRTLPPQRSNALDIAARTASVSHTTSVSASYLQDVFTTGKCSVDYMPHLYALLEEAPVSLLAAVVAQLHKETGLEHQQLWKHMRQLARGLKSSREIWQ